MEVSGNRELISHLAENQTALNWVSVVVKRSNPEV